MATLDATVGGASANSYSTRAAADDFLTTELLYTSAWTAASGSDQDAALIWATSLLDLLFDWDGTKTASTQALRHPRYGLVDLDGNSLSSGTLAPNLVKGCQMLGGRLLARDTVNTPEIIGLGLSELSIDTIRLKVSKQNLESLIPQSVILLVSHLGSYKGSNGRGFSTLDIIRT